MRVLFKRLMEGARLPEFAHAGDAGMDVFSAEDITIPPGDVKMVKTGIAMQLPSNTEAQIRPRSGLALQHKVTILNTPGTIDEGYRGEIGVILINHGASEFVVRRGMKIAQMVIKPTLSVTIEEVHELTDTRRGTDGFGSTGDG